MSCLVGLGRRTVSGMLCTSGQQFTDWSAAYRLFERERFDIDALFAPICSEAVGRLEPGEPFVAIMDDTLMRKRGRKVPVGAGILWGRRFVQTSCGGSDSFRYQLHCRIRPYPVEQEVSPSTWCMHHHLPGPAEEPLSSNGLSTGKNKNS